MTAPTVRQAKILRVLELMHALKTRPQTMGDVARIIDINESTAYRYLKLIDQLGIEVKKTDHVPVSYYIEECPCCGKEIACISAKHFASLGYERSRGKI